MFLWMTLKPFTSYEHTQQCDITMFNQSLGYASSIWLSLLFVYFTLLYIVTDILQVPLLFKNLSIVALIKPYIIEIYLIKAVDRTSYRFTGKLTHLGCCEKTRKFSKSLASVSSLLKTEHFPRLNLLRITVYRLRFNIDEDINWVIFSLRKFS